MSVEIFCPLIQAIRPSFWTAESRRFEIADDLAKGAKIGGDIWT